MCEMTGVKELNLRATVDNPTARVIFGFGGLALPLLLLSVGLLTLIT